MCTTSLPAHRVLAIAACACLVLALPPAALAVTYVNFNLAGGSFTVSAVNNSGQVTGLAGTSGYLRQASGDVIIFNVPGATVTFPTSINNLGQIAGWYYDSSGVMYGFLRHVSGARTVFGAPDAGTTQRSGTVAGSINDAGQIAGFTIDNSGKRHGFVRGASGSFSSFTPAESLFLANSVLSQNGQVTGWYQTAQSNGVGYVRDTAGNLTTFSVPGSSWTEALAINASGEIAGNYGDAASGNQLCFLRDASGNFSTFSVDWHTFPPSVIGIADNGDVVGYYGTNGQGIKGFIRSAATGFVTSFDDPSAGTTGIEGTFPASASGNGTVAGTYLDSVAGHGFVLH